MNAWTQTNTTKSAARTATPFSASAAKGMADQPLRVSASISASATSPWSSSGARPDRADLGAMRLVDLTRCVHRLDSESADLRDRIVHFLEDHADLLDRADLLATLRQPSRVVQGVQTMLLAHCHAVPAKFVSHRTLHVWLFGSGTAWTARSAGGDGDGRPRCAAV